MDLVVLGLCLDSMFLRLSSNINNSVLWFYIAQKPLRQNWSSHFSACPLSPQPKSLLCLVMLKYPQQLICPGRLWDSDEMASRPQLDTDGRSEFSNKILRTRKEGPDIMGSDFTKGPEQFMNAKFHCVLWEKHQEGENLVKCQAWVETW